MDTFVYFGKNHRMKDITVITPNNRVMIRHIFQKRFLFFWITKTILFSLPQKDQTPLPPNIFNIKEN